MANLLSAWTELTGIVLVIATIVGYYFANEDNNGNF